MAAQFSPGFIRYTHDPRLHDPRLPSTRIFEEQIYEEPEIRLARFLYIGKEYANYQPGYWFSHNYFIIKNVPSIEELAQNEEKQLVPIELIINAFESNLVPHPETLVFALAICCRQNKSEKLRAAAYENVKKICVSPQDFILFINFASRLCREKELTYVTQGWGNGLRKAINNWYLSKEPLDLAKCVTKYKSRYGWKHKDIVKMSHPSTDSPEKEVVLKYILYGMVKIKADLEKQSENPNINKILEYIQEVEDFKHCEDEIQAAALLETYGLSLEHIPGHLLKSKEVWKSLIPSMDIVTLLNNLQRINNLGLLNLDGLTVEKVKQQLTNAEYIAQSKIHPALIFITLKNYEHSGKPLTFEKRKIQQAAKKAPRSPPKPNKEITQALYKAFDLSFAHQQSTNLRYLVTISTNKAMEACTWQTANMTGIETGCLIAMMLLRCETNVTIATFKNNGGVNTVNVNQTQSFSEILDVLHKIPIGSTNLSKPILWAMKEKAKYDVFINIVDQVYEKYDESQNTFISYRNDMQLPQAKLINCSVCCSSTYRKINCDKNILTINGFDATVPIVIQAFSQSFF
ncbi:60 kDa SS-A/Ro ribonucleoprotein-like [Nylanderia fulva]|uniref:60 kDa SS-A/Ro ribonucleoprotein-like n=1 Tax=Nylanderia fulva TaxID=613905 RepID=UPI0010FB847A|nr:60 kDa SS-A/Ro ribonucleoprotein-like [Nylanderia fulva]XP_029156044.1 60 kDa SS-A/Ro ribonucleoprotein-like [Nylanderia fulva]XP_029156045.1 60 kDa SS-A/Ro ribonucleoprotein-like [Nylanderia fulva]